MLIEFIKEIGKKKSKLTTFWGWKFQTQKITITMVFAFTYKRMTCLIYILYQSDTKMYVLHAENRPALAQHKEIRDNYQHQE